MKRYLIVLCLLVVSLGMANSAGATEVKITDPSDGSTVGQNIYVSGTSKEIPSGQNLSVMVYPLNVNLYYPQSAPIYIEPNGNWTTPVGVGSDGDRPGSRFKIFVILADENAQKEINGYLSDCAICNGPVCCPGMQLPDGANVSANITVIRQ